MSSLADTLDRRLEEINATRIYQIRPVKIGLETYQCGESDEGIDIILSFRGTGKVMQFQDILVEYGKYWDDWFDDLLLNGSKEGKLLWLSDWIIKHNYRVLFKEGDIVVRSGHRS